MLTSDVVAIDCKSPGYPCFKNPYAMDFNDSAVTCCQYVVDCPADLICALYKVCIACTLGYQIVVLDGIIVLGGKFL